MRLGRLVRLGKLGIISLSKLFKLPKFLNLPISRERVESIKESIIIVMGSGGEWVLIGSNGF